MDTPSDKVSKPPVYQKPRSALRRRPGSVEPESMKEKAKRIDSALAHASVYATASSATMLQDFKGYNDQAKKELRDHQALDFQNTIFDLLEAS